MSERKHAASIPHGEVTIAELRLIAPLRSST